MNGVLTEYCGHDSHHFSPMDFIQTLQCTSSKESLFVHRVQRYWCAGEIFAQSEKMRFNLLMKKSPTDSNNDVSGLYHLFSFLGNLHDYHPKNPITSSARMQLMLRSYWWASHDSPSS